MAKRLSTRAKSFAAEFAALMALKREATDDVRDSVRAIISEVRTKGDEALVALSQRFDRVTLRVSDLKVSADEIAEAEAKCDKSVLAALALAASRIESFHRRQRPDDLQYTDEAGASLGWRYTPLDSVGLYVPGGTAAYPSSVLMNAIPARVAGVPRIAMATPASGGAIAPLVLAAARLAGVSEIYRVGGAQAVAALAYGTSTITAVDKIVGPGNAYVAEAKREVFGQTGIDSLAGPSEVLVVADRSSNPEWIAADLLAQAEHDASSQSILITDDGAFADKVEAEVARQLQALPRQNIAEPSWRDHGAIIVVASLTEAPALVDRMAPEHLELCLDDPMAFARQVRHAGAIFLGRQAPEAIGDYIAGPNHVLPTSRTARFSSGLSVLDFMKRTTLISCPPEALSALGNEAIALARAEGLEAHARSIALRLDKKNSKP